MIDVYHKEIRSVLEYAVPVWNGYLSQNDAEKIEQVQKRAFKIILGQKYSYSKACETLNAKKLDTRREDLCLKFARKEFSKQDSIFNKFAHKFTSRSSTHTLVEEPYCNTERYYRSRIPYMSRLLNKFANARKKKN